MSIQVRNIRKSFGGFRALDDVSLDFRSGELVALLGPSGCGKTTLLRIIAGLEQPDAGTLVLHGSDASTMDVRERRVGFVFQHYALFRHMSVYDNVAFGLQVKPRRERPSDKVIREKVRSLLSLVQLDFAAARFPSQLSGGQRQRVALARALAVEPKVLLLDEPFGALDAKVRKELRRWLRRLHDEIHVTSIFVTHDQEEALEVSDRVVLMSQGRVEQVGAPEEVYRHPASPFVFGFLGSVNRFQGRLDRNRLHIGDSWMPCAETSIAADSDVVAYVRPHDLDIVREQTMGFPAIVRRVLAFGASVRVELEAVDSNGTRHYEVDLTHERALELDLGTGESVRLVPSRVRVFEREIVERV